jgi:hypothetical protein
MFFSPAISPCHIFDKGVRKAMVHYIYRLRNVGEELKLKAMQWFPDKGHLFIWMRLITARFLSNRVVSSKLAQPLIQRKMTKVHILIGQRSTVKAMSQKLVLTAQKWHIYTTHINLELT